MSFGKSKDDTSSSSDKNVNGIAVASAPTNNKSEAFLGKGTKVSGSLSFNGPVELDGVVEGEVLAKELLTIGEGAVINAKIHGTEIIVKGSVTGDIVATKRLSIRRPARVSGNIASPMLSIEEGVHFEGKCSMNVSGNESRGLQAVPDKVIGAAA